MNGQITEIGYYQWPTVLVSEWSPQAVLVLLISVEQVYLS